MVKKTRQALHRGLAALISQEAQAEVEAPERFNGEIPLDKIEANPFQPRINFDETELDQLKNSIKKHGILEPVLVRASKGKYQLISGERRVLASRAINLSTIPALVREKISDRQMRVLALVENLQRSNLNDLEVALGYQDLLANHDYTHEKIASETGKSRSFVTNTLRLLKLSKTVQDSIRTGKISAGHARAILSIEKESGRNRLFKEILKKHLSVRQAEAFSTETPKKPGKPSTFSQKSPDILDLEIRLAKQLQTRVDITKSPTQGKIVIKFTDTRDLNRILSIVEKK